MRTTQGAPDLAEFVSDYWAIYCVNGRGKRPTAREIAAFYAEQWIAEGADDAEHKAAVVELIPQIKYYLP